MNVDKQKEMELSIAQARIDTERASRATKHVILGTYRKLDKYIPQGKKGGVLKLVGVGIIHAYQMGMRAGSRKRWQVTLTIDSSPKLEAVVYISAVNVVRTGHDLVEADGVPISLPGIVNSVQEREL